MNHRKEEKNPHDARLSFTIISLEIFPLFRLFPFKGQGKEKKDKMKNVKFMQISKLLCKVS